MDVITIFSFSNSSSSSSSSAEALASCDDILEEILLFLPAKPLITFKCVSKRWLSLISSLRFSQRHTRRHRTPSSSAFYLGRVHGVPRPEYNLLSLNPKLSPPLFDHLSFTHDPTGIKILQSCNGLLLCCSSLKVDRIRHYYVYNPATKKFSTLPLPLGFDGDSSCILGVYLAFEPCKSPHYKVVCVRTTPVSYKLKQIEIYSSETRAWRICGEPFAAPFGMPFNDGVLWNGSVHWLSPTNASLYFDIGQERFGSMPELPDTTRKRRFRYFGESNGHLQFIEIYGTRVTKFDVLEMEKDYSKWFIKYRIDVDAVVAEYPDLVKKFLDPLDSIYYAYNILTLFRLENEEDSLLLLCIPGKIISYNIKDKSSKKLYDISPRPGMKSSNEFGCIDAFHYTETLTCV